MKTISIIATYIGIIAILLDPIYYLLYGIKILINFNIANIYILGYAILVDILLVISTITVYYKK
jgi:hypothetical protein